MAPYSFTAKKALESKSCPGVTAYVRVITEGMRNQVRLETAPAIAELRAIQAKMEIAAANPSALNADELGQYYTSADQIDYIVHSKIQPAWLRAALVRVDGLEIEGTIFAGSADDLIAQAPEDLIGEIARFINGDMELGPQERGNSERSTTSGAAEGGPTNNTTATPAKLPQDCPPIETVAASSPN